MADEEKTEEQAPVAEKGKKLHSHINSLLNSKVEVKTNSKDDLLNKIENTDLSQKQIDTLISML